ncbi:MAG: peptide chain release factor 1 [Parachlamydiaceae bacterium]|nr:peptide chain release factor 1 [Parachlamydiaceae bacterium]
MEEKIKLMLARLSEVEAQLGQPAVLNDQKIYRTLTQEHSYLSEVKQVSEELNSLKKQLEENQALLKSERDPDFSALLREDIAQIEPRIPTLQKQLEDLLVPPDPNDHRNIILEIRAGTGGDEAALFVGDCVRMYKLFADVNGWRYDLLSCTHSEVGGFKEYIMSLAGHNVYRLMRYEGGTHRVQRVPDTEAQGRIHTSAITIAVLLEPDEETEVVVDEKDLRVDTYRSSGAGGQHVNTTDSAVRLTHLPTGIVVYCQEERSQHKNKDKAMRWLKAEIVEREQRKIQEARASDRATQVGSGDRSERIRTYNFPQNRITDHRINLTKHNLDRVMDGDLGDIASALVAHYRQEEFKA